MVINMKKRIFTALVAAMLLLCSVMGCFAADKTDIISVKNTAYDAKTKVLSFTLANTSQTEISDSVLTLNPASDVKIETPQLRTGAFEAAKR